MKYSPRTTMLFLDAVSWAYIENVKSEFNENSLIHPVHFVISNRPISNERLEQFKEEAWEDPIWQILLNDIIECWSENNFYSASIVSVFDIFSHEGLILGDQWITASSALRSEIKSILHQGYLGIYWPLTKRN